MGRSLLIEAAWIVPVDPQFNIIKNGAILIRDDKILKVGRIGEIDADGAEVRSFPHHVVIPGLVNAHTHVVGAVFRGLLEDRRDGFYGFALPMEPFLDAEASYSLSRLGIGELQLAGCTAMNDMFHYSEETLRAAQDAGIRAQVAHKVFDTDLTKLDTGRHITDVSVGQRLLQENIDLYQAWNGKADGRLEVRFGAHAADTCSPELLMSIRAEAEQRDAGIHTHVAQTTLERDFIQETYGCGSVEHMEHHDMLGPATIAVHLLFADDIGIETLASTGTGVAHCPAGVSNVGEFGPLREIYDASIPVGWGTDWTRMDPWDAMRFGVAGLRLAEGENYLLNAREALWHFTMGSAEIMGWNEKLGSLEAGKKADLTVVDIDQPHLSPLYDPVTVLVYNAGRKDVTHVMVDGEFTVEDGKLLWADHHELVADAQSVSEGVWGRGGLAPFSS